MTLMYGAQKFYLLLGSSVPHPYLSRTLVIVAVAQQQVIEIKTVGKAGRIK